MSIEQKSVSSLSRRFHDDLIGSVGVSAMGDPFTAQTVQRQEQDSREREGYFGYLQTLYREIDGAV